MSSDVSVRELGEPKAEHVLVWNVWMTWSATMRVSDFEEWIRNAYARRWRTEIDWTEKHVKVDGRIVFFFKYL